MADKVNEKTRYSVSDVVAVADYLVGSPIHAALAYVPA